MHGDSDKLSAALTGIAVSAAAHVIRRDDDNTNRLRQNEDDIDSINRRLASLINNGHIVREMLPIVADYLSGVAVARAQESQPTLVPTFAQISRPDLVSLMTAAVKDFQWPPKTGNYTPQGYITNVGEMTSQGLINTYEEFRAFCHGLILPSAPTGDNKLQAFFAASGLMRSIIKQAFTQLEWEALWTRLFKAAQHAATPSITLLTNAATVTIGAGANDLALNIKLSFSAVVNAGTQVLKVTFGKKFTNTPAVIAGGPWDTLNVSDSEFILATRIGYNANESATVSVIVGSCDA